MGTRLMGVISCKLYKYLILCYIPDTNIILYVEKIKKINVKNIYQLYTLKMNILERELERERERDPEHRCSSDFSHFRYSSWFCRL